MIGLKEEAGWKIEYISMCRNKSRVNVDHAPVISTIIFQIPLISTKIVRKNIYALNCTYKFK